MIRDNRKRSQGFTLIELMLSMAFVSALLLAIAMTIIQAGNIYNKGMALKDINQSARSIATDMQRTIATAGNISLGPDNYIVQMSGARAVTGRLCLGNYSYIWNTIDATTAMPISMRINETELIKAVKIPDATGIYCARDTSGALTVRNTIRPADVSRITQLLVDGDHELSIASFAVTSSDAAYDNATGQRLFTISYAISTGDAAAMTSDRNSCREAGSAGANPIYCNVQRFDLVVRSGGGV